VCPPDTELDTPPRDLLPVDYDALAATMTHRAPLGPPGAPGSVARGLFAGGNMLYDLLAAAPQALLTPGRLTQEGLERAYTHGSNLQPQSLPEMNALVRDAVTMSGYAAGGAMPFGRTGALGMNAPMKMPTWAEFSKLSSKEAMKHVEDALGLPSGEGANWHKVDISDAAIAAKLAKDPGASIFDVSGAEAPPAPPPAPLDPHALPREAQWTIPPEAQAQGYNVAVHHGTNQMDRSASGSHNVFDEFKLPDDELGVHFGSPRAAQEIMPSGTPNTYKEYAGEGNPLGLTQAPRVYPSAIVAQNPLRMPDAGTWEAGKVANKLHLMDPDKFPMEELKRALAKDVVPESFLEPRAPHDATNPQSVRAFSDYLGNREKQVKNLRNYLESKGHDSIVYENTVEDPGHDSYILFRESPHKPGYVYGARVPWAKFDPAMFKHPGVLRMGVPLAAATGAYALGTDGKPRELRPAAGIPEFADE
jgi:hypothetical protein